MEGGGEVNIWTETRGHLFKWTQTQGFNLTEKFHKSPVLSFCGTLERIFWQYLVVFRTNFSLFSVRIIFVIKIISFNSKSYATYILKFSKNGFIEVFISYLRLKLETKIFWTAKLWKNEDLHFVSATHYFKFKQFYNFYYSDPNCVARNYILKWVFCSVNFSRSIYSL